MALLRDPDRPALFDLVFWVMVAVLTAAVLTDGPLTWRHVAALCDLLLLTALWPTLPWRPARGWRRPAAPVFLVNAIALGWLAFDGSHLPLILLAIASIAFQYGVRTGAVVLAAVYVPTLLGVPLFPGRGWLDVLSQALPMLIFSAFVLAMVSAVLEARRRGAEAQSLLLRVRELAVAEERARMARDMHDSVGHHLTVIKMGLENAERFRERSPEIAWGEVRQAKQLTAEAMAETRRWVRALRPLALGGRIGGAALRQLADSFSGTGMRVDFAVEGHERPLHPDAELVLYRALQEGLTNALRHARATHVRGVLTFGEDRVELLVADDGRGARQDGGSGFGLVALAERAASLGGDTRVGDAEGGGFELRVGLPAVPA